MRNLQNSDQALLIQCGYQEHSGHLHLHHAPSSGAQYLLFAFDSSGQLRTAAENYTVAAYSYLLLPFDVPYLSFKHSVPLHWAQLQIPQPLLHTMEAHGFQIGETVSATSPLALAEIWKILLAAPQNRSTTEEQILLHAVGLMLGLLQQRTQDDVQKAIRIPHYEKLDELRRSIYQTPAADWSIQEICDALCMSRPYFHKLYLSAFGTTCTQDVIASRIALAKELLEHTDDAVFEISQKCGFETDVYFMRQFKRRIGMTPTAYRRLCRKAQIFDK